MLKEKALMNVTLVNRTVSYSREDTVALIVIIGLNCIEVTIYFGGHLCYNQQQQEYHIVPLYQALFINCDVSSLFLSTTIDKLILKLKVRTLCFGVCLHTNISAYLKLKLKAF